METWACDPIDVEKICTVPIEATQHLESEDLGRVSVELKSGTTTDWVLTGKGKGDTVIYVIECTATRNEVGNFTANGQQSRSAKADCKSVLHITPWIPAPGKSKFDLNDEGTDNPYYKVGFQERLEISYWFFDDA